MKTKLLRKLRKRFKIKKSVRGLYEFSDGYFYKDVSVTDKFRTALEWMHVYMSIRLKEKFKKKILP